jgi:predicted nucleotidyltransferase
MWAGVFGSVSRGTQRPDSDVDIVVGYSPDADFWDDVCGSMASFVEQLPKTLGVEVDVIAFTKQIKTFRYVDMEAMLSAKTVWGDDSWPKASRDIAVDLLQKGYARLKKAEEMMSRIRQTILSIEVVIIKVTSSAH